MVEQMVLIQLDWHLLVPTAVDLFTPFLCYLQAMPLWFDANECHDVVPTAWVDAHTTLWIKSCDYVHRTLAGWSSIIFCRSGYTPVRERK
jgi:hypothetical protein